MHSFPQAEKRGNYKVPERLSTKQQIYKMILDGYPYTKIMDDLQISRRTFYRYLDIIFSEERDLIQESLGSKEEMRRQILICRDRLLEDRRTLQEWMRDPKFKDKIPAMNLSAELTAAILRLYEYGPSYLSKYDNNLPPSRYYNSPLTEKDGSSTGARLILKEQEEQEQQESSLTSTLDPLAYTEETYNKIQENKKKLEEKWKEEQQQPSSSSKPRPLSLRELKEQEERLR